jgi:hypothetical protein
VQKNEYLPAVRKISFSGCGRRTADLCAGTSDCGIEAFSQGDIILTSIIIKNPWAYRFGQGKGFKQTGGNQKDSDEHAGLGRCVRRRHAVQRLPRVVTEIVALEKTVVLFVPQKYFRTR